MKLEKFKASRKKKITIISSIILVFLLMLGIIIYQSYALYEEKKSFNVLNGTVPLFGSTIGTVELAYTINGASSDKPFPNKTSGYGAKSVVCNNGVEASWNDIAWSLEVNNPNNNKKINCTIDFIKTKIYGIERALNSNSSAWTRTNDSIGKVATAQFGSSAVRNDFDNIYPWSDIKSYNYNITTSQVTAWYGDTNFKLDGTNGEVLTYIPEFYYKRSQDGTKEYILISKKELDGYIKSESFSVGRYMISEGIHSKSGALPFANVTITDFRNYAKSLGTGFGQMDYHYFILQLLYLVEYADYNSQEKLGVGNTDNSGPIASGGCNDLGMHSGTINNDGKHSMIYRGIEDIYGGIGQAIDGINIKDNQAYICYDQSKYEVDKYDGCYQKIGYKNATSSGYISKFGYDANNPLIAFPIETLGNQNNIGDKYSTNSGKRVAWLSSFWNSNFNGGIFAWGLEGESSGAWPSGASRLIRIN